MRSFASQDAGTGRGFANECGFEQGALSRAIWFRAQDHSVADDRRPDECERGRGASDR